MTRKEPVLEQARIDPNYVTYHVLATNWIFLALIFTIPLLLISVPLSYWLFYRRYQRLSISLHPKTLKIRQGILVVHEKTIPLNKITDLAISHGPIMRMLGIKSLRVETAGQTGAGGALANVIGIVHTDDFRDRVLDQRDQVAAHTEGPAGDEKPTNGGPMLGTGTGTQTGPLLQEIRDTLVRIEQKLAPSHATTHESARPPR